MTANQREIIKVSFELSLLLDAWRGGDADVWKTLCKKHNKLGSLMRGELAELDENPGVNTQPGRCCMKAAAPWN